MIESSHPRLIDIRLENKGAHVLGDRPAMKHSVRRLRVRLPMRDRRAGESWPTSITETMAIPISCHRLVSVPIGRLHVESQNTLNGKNQQDYDADGSQFHHFLP